MVPESNFRLQIPMGMVPESNFRLRIPTGMVPESNIRLRILTGMVRSRIFGSGPRREWDLRRIFDPGSRQELSQGRIFDSGFRRVAGFTFGRCKIAFLSHLEKYRSTLGDKGLTTKYVCRLWFFSFAELCTGWGESERDMHDLGKIVLSELIS